MTTLRSGGRKVVVKVDMLVEGTDVPRGMGYVDAARKAVAMCVSDFAAKGVRPEYFLASLGLKRGIKQGQVDELGRGFAEAEKEWGVRLVGGDTNETSELVIDCAMVGFAEKVVGRAGARAGDLLVVSGRFGLPPSGLKVLQDKAKAEGNFKERAISSVLRPSPKLEVGLALKEYLTSSMDSSDGLARSIHTLANASGVGFEVEALPAATGLSMFAKANGLSEEALVLEGGEEYLIVGTLKRSRLVSGSRAVRRGGGELIVIGTATKNKGKVVLHTNDGTMRPVRDVGWTHLS